MDAFLFARVAGDNWFVSDIRSGTYPACGFDGNWNNEEGVLYNSSIQSGAPDGSDFIRFAYIVGGANSQHYVGMANNGPHTTVTQGMGFFARELVRFTNGFNVAEDDGYQGKQLVFGDQGGAASTSRIILSLRDNSSTPASIVLQLNRNIDGSSGGTGLNEITKDAWHYVQCYVKSSSSIKSILTLNLTRSGTTATATTSTPHGFSNGASIEIRFADGSTEPNESLYEGVKTITVTGASTFTYTVDAGAPTPATGEYRAMTNDADLRLWIDGDNANGFGSPTDQMPAGQIGISVEAWGAVFGYGFFNNISDATMWSPAVALDLATFQIGPTFDAGWHA